MPKSSNRGRLASNASHYELLIKLAFAAARLRDIVAAQVHRRRCRIALSDAVRGNRS
jgi:hypothetical protein